MRGPGHQMILWLDVISEYTWQSAHRSTCSVIFSQRVGQFPRPHDPWFWLASDLRICERKNNVHLIKTCKCGSGKAPIPQSFRVNLGLTLPLGELPSIRSTWVVLGRSYREYLAPWVNVNDTYVMCVDMPRRLDTRGLIMRNERNSRPHLSLECWRG